MSAVLLTHDDEGMIFVFLLISGICFTVSAAVAASGFKDDAGLFPSLLVGFF